MEVTASLEDGRDAEQCGSRGSRGARPRGRGASGRRDRPREAGVDEVRQRWVWRGRPDGTSNGFVHFMHARNFSKSLSLTPESC